MQPETPRCPSLSSSASSASSPKPVPPLPAGALIQSWLPAARVWWTCPSGAEETETETAAWPMERERGERGERPHLTAQSLETSKSQTLEGITGGSRWVWVTLPGEGVSRHHGLSNSLLLTSVCGTGSLLSTTTASSTPPMGNRCVPATRRKPSGT